MPNEITEEMIVSAPALKAEYSSYLAAEANLTAAKAKDDFTVNFQAKTISPVGGSSALTQRKN